MENKSPDFTLSLSNPKRRWVYQVDDEVSKRIIEAVISGYGVVLDGEPGAGRNKISESILATIVNSAYIVQFTSLKAAFPPHEWSNTDDEAQRSFVYELWEKLKLAAGDLPVVIHIAGSCHVTPAIAASLGLLVLLGGISLFVVPPHFSTRNYLALGRTLNLERIRVPPLNFAQAAQMLREGLDGEISQSAIFEICLGSAYQRRHLEELCLDWVEAGYLHQSNGLWIVSENSNIVGTRARDSWNRILEQLEEDQARALEIVALAKRLPLELLLKMVPSESVDEIYRLGLIETVKARVPLVQLRSATAAEAIAVQVPPGRALLLLEEFQNVSAQLNKPIAAIDLLTWKMASGISVGEPLRHLAAEESLIQGDMERAREFATHTTTHSSRETKALALRILVRGGHMQKAQHLIESEPGSYWALAEQSDEERILFRDEHDSLLGQLRFELASLEYLALVKDLPSEQIPKRLRILRASVIRELKNSRPVDNTLDIALAECDLTLLELANLFEQPSWGKSLKYANLHISETQLYEWQSAQNLAAVWRGEVLLGLQRARELHQLRQQESASWSSKRDPRKRLFELLLTAGEWTEAEDWLGECWVYFREPIVDQPGAQLFAGTVKVLMGQYREALNLLVPEVIQLRACDPHEMLSTVLAGSAYAYARLGEKGSARETLFSLEATESSSTIGKNKLARYFETHARYCLGEESKAEEALDEEIARELKAGNVSGALINLSALISFGRLETVAQMRAVASQSNGRFANACHQFAEAYLNGNRETTILSADSLERLGHNDFSQYVRKIAEEMLQTGVINGRSLEGYPKLNMVSTEPLILPIKSDVRTKIGDLTARQKDIVILVVEGRSNRQIAESLAISVRTVESHLYQVFNRLGIQTRKEITDVWASSI